MPARRTTAPSLDLLPAAPNDGTLARPNGGARASKRLAGTPNGVGMASKRLVARPFAAVIPQKSAHA